jgi:hypothetical protein
MALSKAKPTRWELSLDDKIELIKAKNSEGKSCCQLAENFNIRKSQVSSILKRKVQLVYGCLEENAPSERKRLKVANEMHISELDIMDTSLLRTPEPSPTGVHNREVVLYILELMIGISSSAIGRMDFNNTYLMIGINEDLMPTPLKGSTLLHFDKNSYGSKIDTT